MKIILLSGNHTNGVLEGLYNKVTNGWGVRRMLTWPMGVKPEWDLEDAVLWWKNEVDNANTLQYSLLIAFNPGLFMMYALRLARLRDWVTCEIELQEFMDDEDHWCAIDSDGRIVGEDANNMWSYSWMRDVHLQIMRGRQS